MDKTLAALVDTGEHDSVEDGSDISQETLEKMAETPASQLYTVAGLRAHASRCWARRQMRRWMLGLMFLWGATTATQVWLAISARTMLEKTVRDVLGQIVREQQERRQGWPPVVTFGR
jgi:hypothetical protein